MATINIANPVGTPPYGGTSAGNELVLHFILQTTAAGVLVGGDSAAAIGATDKVRLGRLPAGMRLDDALANITDAATATITGSLGWEYVDGVDVAATPQDASFFFSALATTVARTRMSQAKAFVTLPKEAYLIWTNAVLAHAEACKMEFLIKGEDRGPV